MTRVQLQQTDLGVFRIHVDGKQRGLLVGGAGGWYAREFRGSTRQPWGWVTPDRDLSIDRLLDHIQGVTETPPDRRVDVVAGTSRTALTELEGDVLAAVADGLTYAEIAATTGSTADSVKTVASRAARKLGARDRAHAIALAFRQGILT